MVIGPFINASAVLLGGVLGAVLSQRLPERIRVSMPSIFGLASLGIGILLVVKCANLPVMVLATLLGALIGEFCYLEKGINSAVSKAKNLIARPARRRAAHTRRLSKTMSPSLFCFAPAAPEFSVRCRKG
ncbi:protein YqgA [Enterobacter cancerogenus]|uniref:Protein YqgA n=1 Tax=Enterobacter cancerogenus TaxID=69218 RepID=A0A484Z923_9ENTR|nr:protein YqgA [Enterobacter cancerogenus]